MLNDMEIYEILSEETNMIEKDIDRHIKNGCYAFENFDEFRDFVWYGYTKEEIKEMWDDLEIISHNGKEYRFDYAL